MTTRSGAPYNSTQSQPTASIDPNLESLMRAMTEQLRQLADRFDQMEQRLETLEEHRQAPIELELTRPTPPIPRPHQREFTPEPDPRHCQPDFNDSEERALKSIRLDATSFDGNLDPKVYADWEGEMDHYFEWYDMSEERVQICQAQVSATS